MPLISVVDDDDSIRESLRGLLESLGFAVQTFPSAQTFLDSRWLASTDCLILDVRMPGTGGIAAARRLAEALPTTKIVMLTVSDDGVACATAAPPTTCAPTLSGGTFEDEPAYGVANNDGCDSRTAPSSASAGTARTGGRRSKSTSRRAR